MFGIRIGSGSEKKSRSAHLLCIPVNLVSSRRFILMANFVIYQRCFFLCYVIVTNKEFCLVRIVFIFV